MITDLAALQDIRSTRRWLDRYWIERPALADGATGSIVTLEQVMRTTIREDAGERPRKRPGIGQPVFAEEQAVIVAELAAAFVAQTASTTNPDERPQNARQAVEPVARSYKAGETIIQRGQVISQADLEACRS